MAPLVFEITVGPGPTDPRREAIATSKGGQTVPGTDVIDEVYVVADPAVVRAAACDVDRWRRLFPGLVLTPYDDRGPLGVRWNMTGELTGTAEVWLEEFGDGTIVHCYLRAEPIEGLTVRRFDRRYRLPLKQHWLDLKRELEGSRPPGVARVPLTERVVSPPVAPRVRRRTDDRAEGASRHG